MVRDGLFNDVDIALHWHPGNASSAAQGPSMANISGKFRFHGKSAHAAANPDKGRSALDGVEAMDAMVNLMREHIPDRTRIHYVITKGGKAPNVVPDEAEVYYYVRHTDPQVVIAVMDWVKQAANGAAMGTQTSVEFEQTGGVYNLLPNAALMQVMDRNLRQVGGITWTAEEQAFGAAIQKSFAPGAPPLSSVGEIQPAVIGTEGSASTDVADVSWAVPTVGLSTATFVPGSAGHSWQNAAAAGMSIGVKGAVLAAKTLSLTAAELFRSPEEIAGAKAEFAKRRGPDFRYKALVGDRQPRSTIARVRRPRADEASPVVPFILRSGSSGLYGAMIRFMSPRIRVLPAAFVLVAGAACASTASFAQSAPVPATAQPAPSDTIRLTDEQRRAILETSTEERAAAARGELTGSEGARAASMARSAP